MFQTIMNSPWTNLLLLCCETDKGMSEGKVRKTAGFLRFSTKIDL